MHTFSPLFFQTPCCTTPNSPIPSCLCTLILSAGIICLDPGVLVLLLFDIVELRGVEFDLSSHTVDS